MLLTNNIVKIFPGVISLNNVSIHINEGSVHALLGENGAGKSTLIKVLAGVIVPESGSITFKGKTRNSFSPHIARNLGIRVVYQELSLFDNLSVAENMYVCKEPTSMGIIRDSKVLTSTQNYLDSLQLDIQANQLVRDLSLSQKQLIEIVRAIRDDPALLIMDEPTSSLSEQEINVLFSLITTLKERGTAILYVSHKLHEIFTICDEITVLKDGTVVDHVLTKDIDRSSLIQMMVGRKLNNIFPKKQKKKKSSENQEIHLNVQGISHEPYYHNVHFTLYKGEILGLYGLMGSGRTEIAKGLFGIYPAKTGKIYINNELQYIHDVKFAIKNKIAFITENRKEEGLALNLNTVENCNIVQLSLHGSLVQYMDEEQEISITEEYQKRLSIKVSDIHAPINSVSGGNQQKVVLSKWLVTQPDILIVDEPTRGIDVAAKFEIYQLLFELSNKGMSIILISSELPEIMNLTDRVSLVKGNTIVTTFFTNQCNEKEILQILME